MLLDILVTALVAVPLAAILIVGGLFVWNLADTTMHEARDRGKH